MDHHDVTFFILGLAALLVVARLAELNQPVVALGLADHGIDFDAADGQTCRIIILLLVPEDDSGVQWTLLSEISRLLEASSLRDKLLGMTSFTQLCTLFKLADTEREFAD